MQVPASCKRRDPAILFGRYSVVCLRISVAENSQSTQRCVARCPPSLFGGERPLPWQNTFYAIIILNKFAWLAKHTGKQRCRRCRQGNKTAGRRCDRGCSPCAGCGTGCVNECQLLNLAADQFLLLCRNIVLGCSA